MRAKVLFLAVLLLGAPNAFAGGTIFSTVPDAAVVGRGKLSYAFWDIYEATLFAPQGRWDPARPYALSIAYYRGIDGKDIADRSVQEMRKQGFQDEVKLAAWHTQMKEIFPNVRDGSVLSAVFTPGQQTLFYHGEAVIGAIKGDEFGQLFFGIWLGEKTSEPDLRNALLGQS